jgi:tetratricopeptide (TPR) repeat protein/DNA-binding SARP family transcriptional activator
VELRIQLFGTVELRVGEERSLPGSPKERLALAALAWDAGRTVSVDTLVHRLWDEHPPAKPREALYAHVSRIRKALGALGCDAAGTVLSRTHTYTLRVDPDAVDLRRCLALVEQARGLADVGSDRDALMTLQEASRLQTGEPLAGLPGAWAAHVRSVMAEKNLAAVLLQADIALRQGRYSDAVAALHPLAEQHWQKQTFAGRMALALHGCGRTDEAVGLLQRTVQRLRRDSGTDPGEELAHIHRGILTGAPAATLLPQPPLVPAQGTGAALASPNTLPSDVAWVGRQKELGQLTGTAFGNDSSISAVTLITGMPGSGKSALAIHAAHQMAEGFPDGQLFLNLRSHTRHQPPMTSTEALGELLRLTGTPPKTLPQHLNDLVSLWRSTTRKRRLAVVLDDVVEVEQVAPLLPQADSPARVIITSRYRLSGLSGAQHLALDVLSRTDSVALLHRLLGTERAATTSEADTLARWCGDLPLALTLTARRLLSRPSWGISDLLERLDRARRRLPEIRNGSDAVAPAFEISYQALTPTQRMVFRRLGLHIASEFDPEAAAALSGLPIEETEHALEELLAGHLILEPSPHRFRFHDLLREYASTLTEDDDAEENRTAQERLVHHYLYTADQADRRAYPHRLRIDLPGSDTASEWDEATDARQWFTREGPNLLAALEHIRDGGSPHQLALIAHSLAGFLSSEGYLKTAIPLLRTTADHWHSTGEKAAHGRALIDLSGICAAAGNYDESLHAAQQALHMAQEIGDEQLEAEALHQSSITHWHTGQHAEALSLQQRALRIRLTNASLLQQGRSYNVIGMICLGLDQHKEALKNFLEGLARFRDIGDPRGQFVALNNLAELYKEAGNLDGAVNAYQQAIKLSQALGSTGQYAILQINLADTLCRRGQPQEALELYAKALPALRSAGDRRSEAIAHIGIGHALHTNGDSEQALPHHTAALAIARTIHAALEECQALRALGAAEAATGRHTAAHTHLTAALALSRKLNDPAEEAKALQALTRARRALHPDKA